MPLAGRLGTQLSGWRGCQSRKPYIASDLRHNISAQQIHLLGIPSTERALFISPVTSTLQHSKEPSGNRSQSNTPIFNTSVFERSITPVLHSTIPNPQSAIPNLQSPILDLQLGHIPCNNLMRKIIWGHLRSEDIYDFSDGSF